MGVCSEVKPLIKIKEKLENISSSSVLGKTIKSPYIIRRIFSFLTEKKKFAMILYNKKLQRKLDLDLDDYKKFSGIYIIAKKGYAKGYKLYTNKVIFEDEYLNGKKNGKGKEYNYEGKVIFEGEYLNGKKHGKGKEYNDSGNLIFEGEYLNDKKIKGKKYDNEGNLILKLFANGEGKEYYQNDI